MKMSVPRLRVVRVPVGDKREFHRSNRIDVEITLGTVDAFRGLYQKIRCDAHVFMFEFWFEKSITEVATLIGLWHGFLDSVDTFCHHQIVSAVVVPMNYFV